MRPMLRVVSALLMVAAFATAALARDAAKPTTKSGASALAAPAGFTGMPADLPRYAPPAAYQVDLVIHTDGRDLTMKRSVDGGRTRTDMNGMGRDMAVIEMDDEPGTIYTLMPEEKQAMKQTRAAMAGMSGGAAKAEAAAESNVKVEDLGRTTLNGQAARKLRLTSAEGVVLGWFDSATGAPLRMETSAEGQEASIEWRNLKPGPQPASSFTVPKGYEVTDMDEMMAKMKSMKGGIPGLGAGGIPGMGAGGVNGMAGMMGQGMGSSMGGTLGGTLGGALGGPLGAVAGQYLGGKIGGAVGKKAAEVVTPGK